MVSEAPAGDARSAPEAPRRFEGIAIAIRPAQLADMPDIGRIYVSGHWAGYRGSVPYGHLRAMSPVIEANEWANELNHPGGILLVAENRTPRIIGFLYGGMTTATMAGLAELFVDGRYRGRGVAQALLIAFAGRVHPLGAIDSRTSGYLQRALARVLHKDWCGRSQCPTVSCVRQRSWQTANFSSSNLRRLGKRSYDRGRQASAVENLSLSGQPKSSISTMGSYRYLTQAVMSQDIPEAFFNVPTKLQLRATAITTIAQATGPYSRTHEHSRRWEQLRLAAISRSD